MIAEKRKLFLFFAHTDALSMHSTGRLDRALLPAAVCMPGGPG